MTKFVAKWKSVGKERGYEDLKKSGCDQIRGQMEECWKTVFHKVWRSCGLAMSYMPCAKQLVVSCVYFCSMLCIALSSELIFSQNAQLFQKTSTGVPSDFHLATNFEVGQNATFLAEI